MKKLSLLIVMIMLTSTFLYAEDLYDQRLDKGLTNSEFYSYHLIEKAHNEPSRVIEYLEEALKFSPDLPAAYFHLAWVTITTSPAKIYDSASYFFEGFNAYNRNFWWSFNILGITIIGTILAFGGTIIIIAMVRLPVDLPLINHEIKEDGRNFFLFILVFFMSGLGPLYFLASVLMLISFHFKKSDTIITYAFFIALILLPLFVKPIEFFISTEMSSALRAIISVNEGRDNNYALDVLEGEEDREALFSYALALKREGRLNKAIAVYQKILEANPNDPAIYNNIGNCYFMLGQKEDAMAMYKKAVEIKPLVSSYYNLSQLYRDMLEFEEGDRYFDEARRIDIDAVKRFRESSSRDLGTFFYIDETLHSSDFWSYALRQSGQVSLPGTFIPLWLTPIAGILMTVTFSALSKTRKNKASSCKRCGSIICPKCERSLKWGEMCHDCFTALVTFEKDPRDRIAKIMTVQDKKKGRKTIIFLLSLLMPGSNLIYTGKILKGAILAFLFLISPMLIIASLFHRIAIYPYMHSWLIFILAIISILFYIVNIFATRRLLKTWV